MGAFREFKTLNDSLYSAESRTTIARLEDSFRRDKEKKVFELEAQRKDAESARRQTWNIALGIALFFLALTAFLLYKVMQGRVRHSALEQETLRLHGEKLAAEQAALKGRSGVSGARAHRQCLVPAEEERVDRTHRGAAPEG